MRTLIDAQDSAHGFTLTPSDRLNIETADLLLWISPEFEVQIADLFESKGKEKPVIAEQTLLEYLLFRFLQMRLTHIYG
ncbi:MAG: hypothetical protein Ct9H300mP22_4220 [Gammaproteobacteria bacterium]|nr:MAG: hypothetical protein Ct9H300mP22_4220 [Gammaproteobacteria bacterium]